VKYLVASGVLGPGEELPPIRALAEQLLINPNTAARAALRSPEGDPARKSSHRSDALC